MLNNFNFNHLYYFYIIAKNNSIAKSTKELNVSQPTLSQQLKHFEEYLGHDLFTRKGRSITLNKRGEYLLDYCHEIFSKAEAMLEGFPPQVQIDNNTISTNLSENKEITLS